MIRSFKNQGTEDVFDGVDSKTARKLCPADLLERARRKLERVDDSVALADLAVPPGNKLEPLKGDRKGQHSIRINDRYRICFRWADAGPEDVEIVDYH